MGQSKVLTVLIFLVSNRVLAHQDFSIIKSFGNVKVEITTGFQYEEIKKAWIIGELAKQLSIRLGYKSLIAIDLTHYYVGECEADYFVCFDRIRKVEAWKMKTNPEEEGLVVREVSRQFSPSITLKLVEYAIQNVKAIKSTQKTIEYDQNYCNWKTKTIDTLLLKRIAAGAPSKVVDAVLNSRVYRLEDESNTSDISYYFQHNRYHLFYNEYKVKDSVLLAVENVYQFKSISFNEVVAFDTDSSFFYIKGVNNPHSTNRKVIQKVLDNYHPFSISKVGSYKVTFSFWYYEDHDSHERNVLYEIDKDQIIQDLDKHLSLQ